jgi:hypothetical protein
MAVSSPTFAAPDMAGKESIVEKPAAPASAPGADRSEKACRIPTKRAASADEHAPSVSLPLRFILAGLVALYAGVVALIARPDILAAYHYNQHVLAVTHLFVLGWICSIVMGAMYQLVPVALETRLFSERLAKWHFVLHLIGFLGMVWMFWVWNMKQVGHFGSAVTLGAGFFVYNLVRTLARIPRWNVVATGIASALFWVSMTVLAGLYLAAAKCWNFSPFNPVAQMHAHAHLGVLGFFILMIVAVSYKLVPMFMLTEVQSVRRAAWSIGLINAGLLGVFLTVLLGSPWKVAAGVVVVAGLAVYGIEIAAMLRARKRRAFDWGLRYFITALTLLVPLAGLGLVLALPWSEATPLLAQLENVYGLVALLGVVTLAILGMLYKIVPFLVWYASYSKAIGRYKVPAVADMYSARWQAAGYWPYLIGLGTLAVAAAVESEAGVRWGVVLLLLSLAAYAVNLARIFRHLRQPSLEPLAPQRSAGRAGAQAPAAKPIARPPIQLTLETTV